MEHMHAKKVIPWIVIAIVVVSIGFAFLKQASPNLLENGPVGGGEHSSPTNVLMQKNIAVPEKNFLNVPANIAKPQTVAPAGPGASVDFRSFELKIQNNQFIPDTVIVYQGDVAHISITALDHDYDLTQPDYGTKLLIPKGQTKVDEFQAGTACKYTFFCERCGGLTSKAVGYVIVVPR